MTTGEGKRIFEFIGDLDKERGLDEEEIAAAQENTRVASTVREFLEREGHAPAHQVHVVSRSGQVDLSGEVSWLLRVHEAERTIVGMPGVSGVTNRLVVRPFESEMDLKARVVDALVARAHSVASRITVERQDGIVTLRGTLSSALYREVAGEVAKGAAGASKVEDRLMIEAPTR